jgi:hypothetical protein
VRAKRLFQTKPRDGLKACIRLARTTDSRGRSGLSAAAPAYAPMTETRPPFLTALTHSLTISGVSVSSCV